MAVVIETVERVSKLCLCSCTLKFSDFTDVLLSYAAFVMQLNGLVSRDNGRPLFSTTVEHCSHIKVAKTIPAPEKKPDVSGWDLFRTLYAVPSRIVLILLAI